MIKLILAFLLSLALTSVLLPFIIKLIKRKRATQTILGYVENHKEKNGTPTMGGVVFMLSTLVLVFFFLRYDGNWFVPLLVSLFFGVLGFMDDAIKIRHKQNLGLRPYQKIIGQAGISIIFALFIYFTFGGNLFIPFVNITINIGFWIVPLVFLVMLATTNSVNLTDGLDGLAGSVTGVYLVGFIAINIITYNALYSAGETGVILNTLQNVNIISALFLGSIAGFLIFNTNKASIFMGDVGSLCLGGFIGASACVTGQILLVPILGICFVISALSVIIQVAVFKLRKKRVFKMAPFHHHLQLSGLSEPKIVWIYSLTTICVGLLMIVFYLV